MRAVPRVITTCPNCGKDFPIEQWILKRPTKYGRFCSAECRSTYISKFNPASQQNRVRVKCAHCGRPMSMQPYRTKGVKHNFCSMECLGAYTAQQRWEGHEPKTVTVQCFYCDNEFELAAWAYASKRRRGQTRFFCDRACFSAWKSATWNGEANPAWKGGWTPHGTGWDAIREVVRHEQDYQCADCGVTEEQLGKQLDVHHLVPARVFASSNEASQRQNLIGLCHPCHMKREWGVESPLFDL
jgi:hypothetical protein